MADLSRGWADTEKLLTQDVCNVNAKLLTMKGVCSPPPKNHTWLFHLRVNTPKKNVQRMFQNFSSFCEHAQTLKRGCRGAERDRMENKVCIWSDLSREQMQLSSTIWTDGLYPFSVVRQCMQKFANKFPGCRFGSSYFSPELIITGRYAGGVEARVCVRSGIYLTSPF